MTQEIAIHRAVHHQHIVEFYSFFEDDQNVYIILELCRRRVSFLSYYLKFGREKIPVFIDKWIETSTLKEGNMKLHLSICIDLNILPQRTVISRDTVAINFSRKKLLLS